MGIKYGINGFGRIGRNVVRAALKHPNAELVAVNDLTDATTLAHLLKYDSVHGKFPGEVSAADKAIVVNGKKIKVFSEKDPKNLPWKDLGVDVVMECTGLFTKREGAAQHLAGGAKHVIISAPSPDADMTVVCGVNHQLFDPGKHHVISNGSCTTNCLAPVAKVILENFGIVRGMMTTIHSYTNDQQILDLPHKDLRRARAAGMSMIPTSTGAAKALSLVIPELKGKLDGIAVRVPTPNVSLVDLVCEVERDVTVQEVNQALVKAAEGPLSGILAVTDEPLVSIDLKGHPASSIADLQETLVLGGRMVKVLAWYDNEMGFSYRMVDLLELMAGKNKVEMKFGTPLFVANWKMNTPCEAARQYMHAFRKSFTARADGAVDTVFAPPFTSIAAVGEELRAINGAALGAQNVHWLDSGPHTGEVSPSMLAELGVKFAIVGHSERRMVYGETSEFVAKRAKAAIAHGIVPIVCVGETLFYEHDDQAAFSTVREQLGLSLAGIEKSDTDKLVLAYEPVWAIGTGRAATPEIVRRMHSFIRSEMLQRYENAGASIPILYGGSTTPENIGPIMTQANVSGALVGSTSLKPDQFSELIVRGREAFRTPQ